jgi:peptide/nickel transport system substrate-binding protein
VPTGNMYYLPGTKYYQPVWDNRYKYDPQAATQLLESHGCQKDADGVYKCDGQRLEFGYLSTTGNESLQLMFDIVQAQLKQVGIKLNADFTTAAVAFGQRLPAGQWDIIVFAPAFYDPTDSERFLRCNAAPYFKYCNEEVDSLFDQGATTIDPDQRAGIYNQIQALLAKDVAWIPMYYLTGLTAFKTDVSGPTANGNGYVTWNVDQWN